MATSADFRFVIDVTPSEGDYNAFHLSHVGTARLFDETRNRYLYGRDRGGGVSWPDTAGQDLLPMVKEVLIRHEHEAQAGEMLLAGARPAAQGRRSLVVEEALWTPGDTVVATCRCVLVAVDRAQGQASEIPVAFWEALAQYKGHSIPSVRDMPAGPPVERA
jgi:acyl-CoA thioesterase FadM